MSYSYQPRDPRGKLREVAAKWVSAMRVTGRAPNRGIVFAGDSGTADFAKALADALLGGSGWLADGGDEFERVPDRRGERRPHQGAERRGRG